MPTSLAALLVSFCLLLSAPAAAQDAPDEAAYRTALKLHLAPIAGADRGKVERIADASLTQLFPAHRFFALQFPQYPVARPAPEGLSSSNIFAVFSTGEIAQASSEAQLKELFTGVTAQSAAEARIALHAWLALVEQLYQDGFYAFSTPQFIDVYGAGDALKVEGHVTATKGGEGKLTARLTFNAGGTLADAQTLSELRPDIRPICQATKLLDADPIVRKMAEQDIVVMGSAAKPYLDEQRAKAHPALRREIDRVWARIVAEGR